MPEDVLAVAGHCCSVRLTHLPEVEDGIDFTPSDAARAAFAEMQRPAAQAPAPAPAPAPIIPEH